MSNPVSAGLTLQPEIVQLIIFAGTAVNGLISFFSTRTLNQVDKSQSELFSRVHTIEKDFYTMYGEHKSNHKED
jgi:hypothetical protein